jgi:hypothetical protein
MQKSETIAELTKALVKVQSSIKPAIKDANNPFFKSSYADLNSVWDSCRDLLAANGLAVIQTTAPVEHAVIVETTLAHTSGEWISGELMLPLTKQDAQGVGSAITYGRRYGLAAIVGIVADVDDDGNAASRPAQAKVVEKAMPGQIAAINNLCKEKDIDMKAFITEHFPTVTASSELTKAEAQSLLSKLK